MTGRSLNQSTTGVLAILAGLILVLGFIAANLPYWAEFFGRQITQNQMSSDYFFGLVWACILGVTILFWPVSRPDRRVLLLLWLAKCFVALGVMLLYEGQYGKYLDSISYYIQSGQTENIKWSEFLGSGGTQFIVRLCAAQNYLLPYSYHALKVTFALVGLLGIYLFYRAAVRFLGHEDWRVLFALGFLPSILFWSSILGKDPVVLFALGLYAYGIIAWYRTRRWSFVLLFIIGLALATLVRMWLVPIFTAPLVVFAMHGQRGRPRKIMMFVLVMAGFWFGVRRTTEHFRVETTRDLVGQTHNLSRRWARGGSAETLPEINSLDDMIKLAPTVVFTALFRPLPGEVPHSFGWLAGTEDLGMLLLLALALLRIGECWGDLKEPVVLWAIFLILAWASVYGFVSFQNLGTAVRYRLQIMPFLWGLLLYLNRRRPAVPARVRGQKEKVYAQRSAIPQSSSPSAS